MVAVERARGHDIPGRVDQHHLAVGLVEVQPGAVGPEDEDPTLLVDLVVLGVAARGPGDDLVAVEAGHDLAIAVADDGLPVLGADVVPPARPVGERAAAELAAPDLLLAPVTVEPEERGRVAGAAALPADSPFARLDGVWPCPLD